jgi:hypothetical protein
VAIALLESAEAITAMVVALAAQSQSQVAKSQLLAAMLLLLMAAAQESAVDITAVVVP